MIAVRSSGERQHVRKRTRETWSTFPPRSAPHSQSSGLGFLARLDESRIAPGSEVFWNPSVDGDVVTYVFGGTLSGADPSGGVALTQSGEFQQRAVVAGTRYRETNPSRNEWAHIFKVGLSPPEHGRSTPLQTRRFSVAERRDRLCLIASRDGREGSLEVRLDAAVFSAVLGSGRHLAHAIARGGSAWLHVVTGDVRMGEMTLGMGDGASVTAEQAVSVLAQTECEILLVSMPSAPDAAR